MDDYRNTSLLYANPLATEADIQDFRLEGQAIIRIAEGNAETPPQVRPHLRMRNRLDPSAGQKANFVFWCPEDFPADIAVTWDFWPLEEPGLCILFFAATGRAGEDLFDERLATRTGIYGQYHHGDINAFHISYFRRRWPKERAFHTCNLRKSYGFHMVAQGADPIPSVADADSPYHIELVKCGAEITFAVNDLVLLRYGDDGETYGPRLGGGKIGFRQMAPLVAGYANLNVHAVEKACGVLLQGDCQIPVAPREIPKSHKE